MGPWLTRINFKAQSPFGNCYGRSAPSATRPAERAAITAATGTQSTPLPRHSHADQHRRAGCNCWRGNCPTTMTTLNHEPGDDLAAAVTVPSKQLVAIRPRFNDDERRRLHVEHELTTEQIALLERHLGVILDQLGPHDRMQDVRSDLQGLCKVLTKADAVVNQWRSAVRPSPGAQALGLLNIAGAEFERRGRKTELDSDSMPDLIVASDLVRLVAQIARQAADASPQTKRVPNSASPRAIATILERLNRPTDSKSKLAAARLVPRHAETAKRSGPSFRGVADIVFAAASRALNDHQGNLSAEVQTAETSIRVYLEQLPADQRRRRGRPKAALPHAR